jgi:hypothetical protein
VEVPDRRHVEAALGGDFACGQTDLIASGGPLIDHGEGYDFLLKEDAMNI